MSEMDDIDGQDILEGLSQPQEAKVLGWIDEFRLTLHELSAWRKDREVFVKFVKYKVPVETPVDLICRDIYELKLFGLRVADFFHKNGEPAFLKLCGRLFTREEAMRWVSIKPHLQKPFVFGKGEPQKILNGLSSGTRSTRKRKLTASELGSRNKRSTSACYKSAVGDVGRSSQRSDEERPKVDEAVDQKPSQEELDRASAEFARTVSTEASQVKTQGQTVREAETSNASASAKKAKESEMRVGTNAIQPKIPKQNTAVNTVTLNAPITSGSPGEVTAPIERSSQSVRPLAMRLEASPSLNDAMVPSRLPEDPACALRVVTPQSSQTLANMQPPVQCLVPFSGGNAAYPGSPIYTFTTNAQIQTVYPAPTPVPAPATTQDDASRAYQAMVEIYLKQFKVGVKDFSNWLKVKYKSNSVPQDELFARADEMLTEIIRIFMALRTNLSDVSSRTTTFAKYKRFYVESLQLWSLPEHRSLFDTDRTALKYDLFQRVFPSPKNNERPYVQEEKGIMEYHEPAEFVAVKLTGDPVDLVVKVLDFYSLDGEVLDDLPMDCNRGFLKKARKNPLEMLFYDLSCVISHLNEISMFSRVHSPQETASCFEIPVSCIPPSKNMFHVSVEDAARAMIMRPRLRFEYKDFADYPNSRVDPQRIRNLLAEYRKN